MKTPLDSDFYGIHTVITLELLRFMSGGRVVGVGGVQTLQMLHMLHLTIPTILKFITLK